MEKPLRFLLEAYEDFGQAEIDALWAEASSETIDLALNMAKILNRLPKGTQKILVLLQSHTIAEVAVITSQSRTNIYRLLEHCRPDFIELFPYLNTFGQKRPKIGIKPLTPDAQYE